MAGFGSNASWILIFLGFIMGSLGLVKLGIILFSCVVAFQVITLPVEFNASARAKQMVLDYGLVSETETSGVAKVLNAAAMTYVAAVITSLLTLLYYLLRSGLLGGGDE
jgi:Zn-dependent membrane protease YugP